VEALAGGVEAGGVEALAALPLS